jgi:hypothetical protein
MLQLFGTNLFSRESCSFLGLNLLPRSNQSAVYVLYLIDYRTSDALTCMLWTPSDPSLRLRGDESTSVEKPAVLETLSRWDIKKSATQDAMDSTQVSHLRIRKARSGPKADFCLRLGMGQLPDTPRAYRIPCDPRQTFRPLSGGRRGFEVAYSHTNII